jgi:hypothetical protein
MSSVRPVEYLDSDDEARDRVEASRCVEKEPSGISSLRLSNPSRTSSRGGGGKDGSSASTLSEGKDGQRLLASDMLLRFGSQCGRWMK